MIYNCRRCGYSASQKSNLKNHFNRKKICKPVIENISIETLKNELEGIEPKMNPNEPKLNPNEPKMNPNEPKMNPTKYQCKYCYKYYSTNSHMHRHQHKCKKKPEENSISVLQLEEIELLKKQVADLLEEKTKCNNYNSNNTNNIDTQNNINITINGFGSERTDYISNDYIRSLFNVPYGAIPRLLEKIHFNPDHPENWNVKITNDKKPDAQVYDSEKEKWVVKDKKDTINSLLEKGYGILDDHYEKAKEDKSLEDKINIKFRKFQSKYEDNDKTTHKNLNSDIRRLLVGYKDYICLDV